MSRTYKAIGMNLKSMPLGEFDRLLTILTREYGLIRVVAPGVRKPKSKLGGRMELFVVNELLLSQGRSLDKVIQAETLTSYPGLSQNLAKLAASQYLAELALYQALSDQPQAELFSLLCAYLTELEQAPTAAVLPRLTQAIFHLLVWAGIAPQVQTCCHTQQHLVPNFNQPDWRIEFNLAAGGTVSQADPARPGPTHAATRPLRVTDIGPAPYGARPSTRSPTGMWLTAIELEVLQCLAQPHLQPLDRSRQPCQPTDAGPTYPIAVWQRVEQVLRQYIHYQLDRPIRSAALMDTCFSAPDQPLPTVAHDSPVPR